MPAMLSRRRSTIGTTPTRRTSKLCCFLGGGRPHRSHVLGDHPQSLINSQGVDKSDIVFALFGSRLGSPTPDAVSGTVEEVERAVERGKPVHLYFSTAALPNDVDTRQLDGLREFRAEISQRGLLGEFATTAQLGHEVWKAIEYDIAQLDLGVPVLQPGTRGVRFSAQPQQEREVKSYDNKGKPRYSNRHWIEVTNSGDKDATDVSFESVGDDSSMMLAGADTPTVIRLFVDLVGSDTRGVMGGVYGSRSPRIRSANH